MARRKGEKIWNAVSREEWLALFAAPEIMTDLVMAVCGVLYRARDYEDNAKHIAAVLGTEYRALNAAAGWAGMKIRAWHAARHPGEVPAEESGESRPPWEYLFNGAEETDGTYLWILKPAAAAALREMEEADLSGREDIRQILSEDASSFGREGSLFAEMPQQTVRRIRESLAEEERFRRSGMDGVPRCTVCGAQRTSLLRSVPYGENGKRQRGLVFCPTHGALFAAHLISFSDKGRLLVSPSLSEDDRAALGLHPGEAARNPFSRRRMTQHRRIFHRDQET